MVIGDRVAYSARFLRNIGVYAGEMPFLRGAIAEVIMKCGDNDLVLVKWDGGGENKILDCNLVLESRIGLELN